MKLHIISALSLLVSSATAVPTPVPETFNVMALRSASPIHFAQVSAARSSLLLDLPLSNATCTSESSGHATFYIANEELVLYSSEGEMQKTFVDRSGMGTFYFPFQLYQFWLWCTDFHSSRRLGNRAGRYGLHHGESITSTKW